MQCMHDHKQILQKDNNFAHTNCHAQGSLALLRTSTCENVYLSPNINPIDQLSDYLDVQIKKQDKRRQKAENMFFCNSKFQSKALSSISSRLKL